jgi:hypothetical protein
MANQELHQRRLRIDHVHSCVKRCRSVKDRSRLWKGAAAIGCGTSAVLSIISGCVSRLGNQWFNRDKLNWLAWLILGLQAV